VTGFPARRLRRWLPWVVSLAISAGLLIYLLSAIDLRQLAATAAGIAPRPLLTFVVIFLVGVIARASRFWVLLGRTVPLSLLVGITLVRNLFVDLLPARLGELSYVYLVTTRARRPAEEGVATLGVAFLLDLVALSPLLLVALLVVGGGGAASTSVAIGVSVGIAAGGYAAIVMAPPTVRRVASRLAGPGASERRRGAASRIAALADSLERARRDGVLLPALALSIVVRVCKYGSSYFLVLAILTPLGYTAGELGAARVFLGNVAAEVAASLPIHGLGGFGTYEAAWSIALEELGYPREHAIISGVLAHTISQLFEYVLGGLALVWIMRPGRGGRAGAGAV